ncbi:MAG: VOC family protein, partial [Actinobacteria bacterium]|nr:VOC family protein [Actinomycetota bacterium]
MTPHEAIPVLRVSDAIASAAWYSQLGFVEDFRYQHEPNFPWFVSVSTPNGATIFLSEHAGDAAAGGAIFLVTRDVDAIAAVLGLRARKMPWGDRECSTTDP